MRVLLCPIGSSGDVHPFVGIGLALKSRGHEVVVIVNGQFEPLIRRVGLAYEPLGTGEEFREAIRDPMLWHASKGPSTVLAWVVKGMRRQYEAIQRLHRPGETILINSALGFGARIAHDKLAIPLATLHLQPAIFRSVNETPVLPAGNLPRRAPAFLKRFIYWVADAVMLDPLLERPVNDFRCELGLPPIRHPARDYWHSPQLTLGMFPDWFAPIQPDWPASVRLTGFPLYDERGASDPLPGLEEFLQQHGPPIVFTPGSANVHAGDFFAAAVGACKVMNRPGLLLTRFPEQIPHNLPATVRHFDFVPLSQLLPRSAALVHHGGVGTMSQAMAAGVPQLIMPLSHDQPDNAARIRRLGIGDSLSPKQFTARRVADRLTPLLTDAGVAAACRGVADRLRAMDALGMTCDLIEKVVGQASRLPLEK
ncbi:MAG: glycosyltransferase [Planctomycetes bacterium]|nr:glycosyltransferase [Planctomycetota bacterium]